MTNSKSEALVPTRVRLSTRADIVRARMLERVDALDERRYRMHRTLGHVAASVKRRLPLIGVLAAASVATVTLVALARKRPRAAALPLWQVRSLGTERPSLLGRTLRGAIGAVVMTVVRRASERLLTRLLGTAERRLARSSTPQVPGGVPSPRI